MAYLRRVATNNERMLVRDPPAPPRGRTAALRTTSAVATLSRLGRIAPGAVRVWTFTALLVAVALLGYISAIRSLPALAGPFSIPWPLLAVGFF
ncbi:MAG: hypothetical protein ACRDGI_06850, partial [Candidatus Limnocylindrales bacterium]